MEISVCRSKSRCRVFLPIHSLYRWHRYPDTPRCAPVRILGVILCLSPLFISLVAQMVRNLPAVQEICIWSLGHKDPLEKGMATHSSLLQSIPAAQACKLLLHCDNSEETCPCSVNNHVTCSLWKAQEKERTCFSTREEERWGVKPHTLLCGASCPLWKRHQNNFISKY